MRSLLLKAGATLLTMLAAAGSAAYVTAHPKNGAAPLHPPVAAVGVRSTSAPGTLSLSPGLRTGGVEPVTSTYVS